MVYATSPVGDSALTIDMQDPPEFARYWAQQLGACQSRLIQLRGGINNQVFCCSNGINRWVLKKYTPHSLKQRDRMQSEVQFLRYAATVAKSSIPQLFYADYERRCVVLEYRSGKAFQEGVAPPKEAVTAAVEFFRLLNANLRIARQDIQLDAAEGFLSLSEHMFNVRERLAAMRSDHLLCADLRQIAEALILKLHDELTRTEESLFRQLSQGSLVDSIHPDQRRVSPSDFGFHNAILTPSGVCFIDFEFAGWDDPAKTAVDFILQPRVPVLAQSSPLLDALPLEERDLVQRRCKVLSPILRLKWLCIMLAVLRPDRLKEIVMVIPKEQSIGLIQKRLQAAACYFDQTLSQSVYELDRRALW